MARPSGARDWEYRGQHRWHLETRTGRRNTAKTYQEAARLPSSCGMGCMKTRAHYDSKFWEILEKERLVDLSQFHKPRFFDEVPLYSRESEIAFLAEHTITHADVIILGFAIKFLRAVISYDEHRTPYFAAITVWDVSEGDPIVPNLFVWSGPVQQLKDKLNLGVPITPFGKRMKRLVSKLRFRSRCEVLEDTSTTAEMSRVFIAPLKHSYQGFVALDELRKEEPHARQEHKTDGVQRG
jgi:hypothetical protein